MRRLTILAVLLAGAAARGQEPAPQPQPKPAPDGVVPAITGPDKLEPYKLGVYVLPFEGAELDEAPGLDVLIRGQEAVVTGPPGKYLLVARWGEIDGPRVRLRQAKKVVVIGTPPPPPPPPPPPGPVDPLLQELRTIYAADASPTKGADAAVLGEVYKLMAAECGSAGYRTAADLNAKYKAAVTTAIDGRLIPLRTRCSKEIEAAAGDPDAALTDAARQKLAAAFARLATLLPQVSQ